MTEVDTEDKRGGVEKRTPSHGGREAPRHAASVARPPPHPAVAMARLPGVSPSRRLWPPSLPLPLLTHVSRTA